ncbi:MAG: hypothetical protein Fur0037_01890 [Planctomycetota bacterium]
MRRTLFLLLAATSSLAGPAAAQDPLRQAENRLAKALAAAVEGPTGSFQAKWGEAFPKEGGNKGNLAIFVGGLGFVDAPGEAVGTWTDRLLHVRCAEGGEIVLANRRMIAKDEKRPWCLRRGVTAGGAALPFVPDVPLLLQRLSSMRLSVVHQEVGTLDDRPVEILTATLDRDQITEAFWGGLLPKPPFLQGATIRLAVAGKQIQPAVAEPEAVVDVAIVLDPATSTIRKLTFRSYGKSDKSVQGGIVFMGGTPPGQGGQDEEEEEEEAESEKNAPMEFEDGLPKRSRKKRIVWDYTLVLGGVAAEGDLPPEALELLGIR